jgi:hypothetical protein
MEVWKTVKWVWAHRYSLLSAGFSVGNFLFVFGALNGWFWNVQVAPHTELSRRILSVYGSLVLGSFGMAVLAIIRERPPTIPVLALVLSCLSFFIAGMSMAV